MITYFKYTAGEAFELNNTSYVGFFNVVGGVAYTGKVKGDASEALTPKNTFITDFHLKKLEFDNQFESIAEVTPTYFNVFDNLNKSDLDTLFDTINLNNLLVFKSLVITNPQIVDFDKNDCFYYGLSSAERDERNDDLMISKNVMSHIDPFDYKSEWAFMEKIKFSSMIVQSDQNFKYLCSTGSELYSVSGSFDTTGELTYETLDILGATETISGVFYDEIENTIYLAINEEIKVYDANNYIECGVLLQIDNYKYTDLQELKHSSEVEIDETFGAHNRFFFEAGEESSRFVNFGRNYRAVIKNNVLQFLNKYSTEIVFQYSLSIWDIDNIIDVAVRVEDDFVGIMHKEETDDGGVTYKISFFDPLAVDDTIKTYEIEDIDNEDCLIRFSGYDSNIFFLTNSKQTQTRHVSNPTYPAGRARMKNLKYPIVKNHVHNIFYQKHGLSVIKHGTKNMLSNQYHNLFVNHVTRKNRNYVLIHNSGRLYPLKHNIIDVYQNSIDLNITKNFDTINCSSDSFGLLFNKTISNILKDTLDLYNKATNSYRIERDDVFLNKIEEITYEVDNLYINGNETVNITCLQRILFLLTDIQKKLIGNLVS